LYCRESGYRLSTISAASAKSVKTEEIFQSLCSSLTSLGYSAPHLLFSSLLIHFFLQVSALVENMAHRKPEVATTSTLLGPFHVGGAPILPNGSDISQQKEKHPSAESMYFSGLVLDESGSPIEGAVLDVWHADEEGLYDVQQPGVNMDTGAMVGEGLASDDSNYRGKFKTEADGSFNFKSVRPKYYPIPHDGPVGALLETIKQHHFRHMNIPPHNEHDLDTNLN